MSFYRQMGKLPNKRHVVFRKEDGGIYREQVMGTKGFSGIQSILTITTHRLSFTKQN